MGFFRFVGRNLKPIVDVPSWLGLGNIKDNTKSILRLLKPLFMVRTPARKETFAEAMQRLNVTEADLVKRQRWYGYQLLFFSILGVLCILYAFYLLWHGHFLAGIFALIVAGLFFLRVFEMSFWRFQIKNRKLGCTVQEWLKGRVEEESQ